MANMRIGAMIARLADTRMGEIFQTGLHEFASEAIGENARLSSAIARCYHF